MANTRFRIHPLQRSDAKAFALLRRQCTQANPECFCSSLAEVQQYSLAFYQREISEAETLPHQTLLGCFADKLLLGSIGVEQLHGQLRQHRGRLWGLMVAPEQRRQGIARLLCEHAIEQARQLGIEKLGLELTSEAQAAMQLYRSLGFRI